MTRKPSRTEVSTPATTVTRADTPSGEAVTGVMSLVGPAPRVNTVAARSPSQGPGVARLVGLDSGGWAWIFHQNGEEKTPVRARCAAQVGEESIGGEVAVLFPLDPSEPPLVLASLRSVDPPGSPTFQVRTEGGTLVLEADDQVELRCGRASIVLTAAGKILVQGEYVSTRATGVNRIKGGSVLIN